MPTQLTFSHIGFKTPTRLIVMSIPTFYESINPLGIVIHPLTQTNVSSHFDFPIWPPLQVVFHHFSACKITFRAHHAHSAPIRTFKSVSIQFRGPSSSIIYMLPRKTLGCAMHFRRFPVAADRNCIIHISAFNIQTSVIMMYLVFTQILFYGSRNLFGTVLNQVAQIM